MENDSFVVTDGVDCNGKEGGHVNLDLDIIKDVLLFGD